jgi:heme-degrading protein
MQGGLSVVVDGDVIGAIGVSFATPEEDEQVAKAGLAALSESAAAEACRRPPGRTPWAKLAR